MADTSAGISADEAQRIPDFSLSRAAGCPFAPPALYQNLQKERPVTRVRIWDGSTPWIVSRHADQRALLADPRITSDQRLPGYPHSNAAQAAFRKTSEPSITALDGPEHSRIRRMVTGPFAVRRVEAMRPAIQRITDQLIDQMLAGPTPADLVTALALPVPSLVICELLGVPYEDHEFFQDNSSTMLRTDASAEEVRAARDTLIGYLGNLLTAKAANPADDTLSELAAWVETGEMTHHEAAAMGTGLLLAGHETTANMIALGTLALLEHPEQLAVLRATDDPSVVASAVEELLRYLTIAHSGLRRVALADIEIGGETIRAGEGVILPQPAANWDPEVFPEPERLDLHRNPRRHQAFGFGSHQCLGQPLARVELQVVYGTLYRRIPTLRLATTLDQITFKNSLAYGVSALPVSW
ncbi:cytochrome P450 [Streptomyces sp. NPDC020742]|uniref:cytochrome P450 n=1 Tax=unclassified Streptomyces TaxID=2593676 RepID=UPI0033E0240C